MMWELIWSIFIVFLLLRDHCNSWVSTVTKWNGIGLPPAPKRGTSNFEDDADRWLESVDRMIKEITEIEDIEMGGKDGKNE